MSCGGGFGGGVSVSWGFGGGRFGGSFFDLGGFTAFAAAASTGQKAAPRAQGRRLTGGFGGRFSGGFGDRGGFGGSAAASATSADSDPWPPGDDSQQTEYWGRPGDDSQQTEYWELDDETLCAMLE